MPSIDNLPAYNLHLAHTHRSRWAGTKDEGKTMARAQMVGGTAAVRLSPLGPFHPQVALDLRSELLAAGRSPGTVNRFLAAYTAVWRTALQTEALPLPPSNLYLREPRGRDRVVSPHELASMVDLLPYPYGALAVFLAETGCRVSEALGALYAPGAGEVVLRDTKNGDDRTVPLSAPARGALENAPTVGSVTVQPFVTVSQSAFNHAWSSARESLMLEGDAQFTPHALRHTAITRWVAAGVPLAVVAKLAGHRSIKTTLRYTHISTKDCLTALERAGIL